VKLVDFGIAKAMFSAREETRTGAIKGKIAYMAPEQIVGSPGPESDLFSVGVVLHEMLLGRRLFKGDSDYDTLTRVKTMPVPLPSSIAARIPRELDEIVMRALERDRTQRYREGGLMVRDLDAYLQSARFSFEQMAEWMVKTYPPEAQKEVPDGQSRLESNPAPSSRSKSKPEAQPTSPGTPRALDRAQTAPKRPKGERRMIALAVAIALVVGVGGALIAVGPLSGRSLFGRGKDVIEQLDLGGPSRAIIIRPMDAPDAAPPSQAQVLPTAVPAPSHASGDSAPPGDHGEHEHPAHPAVKRTMINHKTASKGDGKPKIETFDDQ
jgi:serine/threonine protein kinase